MSNTRVLFCVLVLASLGLQAIDVTFTNADGLGDLASPASWGLAAVPDATNRVVFPTGDKSAMTVTASADISFAGIRHNGEQRKVTLDMRNEATGASPGPRAIDLTGSITMGAKWYETLVIKGGNWNLNGMSIAIFNAETSYTRVWLPKITISDGAKFANVGTIQGSYTDSSSTITVAGEGTVVTAGTLKVAFYDGVSNVVRVTGGAELVVTNKANGAFDVAPGSSSYCGLIVSNGAHFAKTRGVQADGTSTSTSYISAQRGRNFFHVLDGSTARVAGLTYIGYSDNAAHGIRSSSNEILVSGTNSVLTMDSVYLGCMDGFNYGSVNTGNTIKACDGATFYAANVTMMGDGNGLVVSNALMDLREPGVRVNSSRGCTNCFVRLQGDRPQFRMSIPEGTGGNFDIKNSFKFIFDVPPTGYAADNVPVSIARWGTTDETTDLVFNGIEELQANLRARNIGKVSYKVLEFRNGTGGHGITADMVERWNSYLPLGASIKSDRGYWLTVESMNGTTVIFR